MTAEPINPFFHIISEKVRLHPACYALIFLVSCSLSLQGQHQEPPDHIPFTVNSNAVLFAPGVISTPLNERDLAISPDFTEIMYTLNAMDNSLRAIVLVKMKGDQVISKEIAPFSGRYPDIEPFYAPDGQRVYFASARPLYPGDPSKDYNIWFAEKINGEWSKEAKPADPVINSDADEYYPAVVTSGSIYFTAAYPTGNGREDIFWSAFVDGRYGAPSALDTAINSEKHEFNAYVSPDERIIIFSSYGRPGDAGGGDLFISTKAASGFWSPARNLGPLVNSPQLDYCPFLDANKEVFYFTSNRSPHFEGSLDLENFQKLLTEPENGSGNIYCISAQTLGIR